MYSAVATLLSPPDWWWAVSSLLNTISKRNHLELILTYLEWLIITIFDPDLDTIVFKIVFMGTFA